MRSARARARARRNSVACFSCSRGIAHKSDQGNCGRKVCQMQSSHEANSSDALVAISQESIRHVPGARASELTTTAVFL